MNLEKLKQYAHSSLDREAVAARIGQSFTLAPTIEVPARTMLRLLDYIDLLRAECEFDMAQGYYNMPRHKRLEFEREHFEEG